MTVKDAAARLEVSIDTVYQLCARGKLRHRRIGVGRGTIRISEDQLADYLRQAEQGPAPVIPARRSHPAIPDRMGAVLARRKDGQVVKGA